MTGTDALQIPAIKAPGKLHPASVAIFFPVLPAQKANEKMFNSMTRFAFAIAAMLILLCMVDHTEANYKNAPMNGIMFGKRGPTVTEYDSRSKAFTALCEIATEACQTWFPSQENK